MEIKPGQQEVSSSDSDDIEIKNLGPNTSVEQSMIRKSPTKSYSQNSSQMLPTRSSIESVTALPKQTKLKISSKPLFYPES